MNVLSYYDAMKVLISNGTDAGFIPTFSHNMVVFVDGPEDLAKHESFDWGTEAIRAIDSWEREPSATFLYDWSKKADLSGEKRTVREENI